MCFVLTLIINKRKTLKGQVRNAKELPNGVRIYNPSTEGPTRSKTQT